MSRILVTGGAGFIGSHVAHALLHRGHAVTVLDDLSGGFARSTCPTAPPSSGAASPTRRSSTGCSPNPAFEYVYHLAAYAAEGLSHFIKRFNYTNNVIGSVTLINAAVNTGVRGFVFASSIAVYGSAPSWPR